MFISKFDYMPPGSYAFVPTELVERELASMPPDKYLVLESGTLLFRKDIPPELKSASSRSLPRTKNGSAPITTLMSLHEQVPHAGGFFQLGRKREGSSAGKRYNPSTAHAVPLPLQGRLWVWLTRSLAGGLGCGLACFSLQGTN